MSGYINNLILVGAGAISGLAEAIIVQPFDMVKTRHQLNTELNKSVLQTLFELYREGGVLRWYRGITAELVGIVPKASGMYASYEIFRRTLVNDLGYENTTLLNSAAGCFSGIPEALIVTPTQVVKIRVQAKEHLGKYKDSLDCLKKVVQSEGLFSLSIGLQATLWRNCVWNTVYFGGMHFIKSNLPTSSSTVTGLVQTFLSGMMTSVIATAINIPFDVAKSRIQSQLRMDEKGNPLSVKYRYAWQTLASIYREEGLAACYKGLHAKVYRTGLGGACSMVVFEYCQIIANI